MPAQSDIGPGSAPGSMSRSGTIVRGAVLRPPIVDPGDPDSWIRSLLCLARIASVTTVRLATAADLPMIARTQMRAFFDDPLITWMLPPTTSRGEPSCCSTA